MKTPKRSLIFRYSIPFLIALVSVFQTAQAQQPKTALDYFNGDRSAFPWLMDSSGKFSIEISTSFSTQESGEASVQVVAAPAFKEVFESQMQGRNQKIPSIQVLESRYLELSPEYSRLPLSERARVLNRFISQTYRVQIPVESTLSALTVEQMKAYPNQISNITAEVKAHLSLGQKIQIASHFGQLFADDYNYGRRGNGHSGYVSLEELVVALSSDESGGVCRDISLAQGQLLNQLGVPADHIYTMAYQTPGAQHAVLIVQDPDSDQIIKINYGKVGTSSKAGSAGLNIGGKHQASGIQYKFYDVKGSPVQTQETALGRLLKDLTGSSPVFADSLAPYSVSKVIMNTQWGDAAIFSGRLLDSNDKVTGVAFNSVNMERWLGPNSEVGVAIIDRNSNSKKYSFDQKGFFLNLRTMREKEFLIGPVKATAQLGAEAQMAVLYTDYQSGGSSKSQVNTEYNANVFSAINFDYENHEAGILAVGYTDFKHIAKGESGGYTLAVNHIRLHAGTKQLVGNDILATGKAFLTIRDVGNTVNFESNLSRSNQSLGLNYQKPLDDIPLFFDGSTEVIRLRGQQVDHHGSLRSNIRRLDLRYDKTQGEAQAEIGFTWRW